jgi:acyl-CoA synthetase (AMP-forming)/AMP-acid ligase II
VRAPLGSARAAQAQAAEWLHVVRDCEPRVLVLQTRAQWEQLESCARDAGVKLPRMRLVFVLDASPTGAPSAAASALEGRAAQRRRASSAASLAPPAVVGDDAQRPGQSLSWPELLAAGDACRARARLGLSRAESICSLVYTSGTTGLPKGVALSNWNILSNILSAWHVGAIRPGERTASFLPWSHAFGATLDLHFMLAHGVHLNLISQTSRLVQEAAVGGCSLPCHLFCACSPLTRCLQRARLSRLKPRLSTRTPHAGLAHSPPRLLACIRPRAPRIPPPIHPPIHPSMLCPALPVRAPCDRASRAFARK